MAVSSSPLNAHSSNMEIGLVSRYRIKAMSRSREMTGSKIMMSRRFRACSSVTVCTASLAKSFAVIGSTAISGHPLSPCKTFYNPESQN